MEENYKRIITSDRVLTNEELTELGVTSINEDRYLFDDALYNARVLTAGGTIPYPNNVKEFFRDLPPDIDTDNIQLLFMADGGCIINTDQYNSYSKGFSLFKTIDFGQNTRINQPRLVGGIAPNSKVAASNQNGESRFFTHPTISFAANEAWSVTIHIKWNGDSKAASSITQTSGSPFTELSFRIGGINRINLYSLVNIVFNLSNTSPIIGKYSTITVTHNGLGLYSLYINGILIQAVTTTAGVFLFDNLLGKVTANTSSSDVSYYRIQSGAMTAAQVLSEATFLRTKYPEIESVVIGTQEWSTRNFEAVATPLGNVIANVTVNGAVEKVPQPLNFTTGWTPAAGGTATDLDTFSTVSNGGIYRASTLILGKWYKCIISGNTTSSNFSLRSYLTTVIYKQAITGAFSETFWFKAGGTDFYLRNEGIGVTDITGLSVTELGWSNATEIYNAVYEATAGDAATKEYAALKEAAMWCYYNNDAANGAIYGKLYNWYAAKLLDLDMLSAGFGWRVPTSLQFTALATYLDGTSVAGGKMKMTGLDYWNTPNTGATNESGFTALGGGNRIVTGAFEEIKERSVFWMNDSDSILRRFRHNNSAVEQSFTFPIIGTSIRLIKS